MNDAVINATMSFSALVAFGSFFAIQALVNYWKCEDEKALHDKLTDCVKEFSIPMPPDELFKALSARRYGVRLNNDRENGLHHLRSLIMGWLSAAIICIVFAVVLQVAIDLGYMSAEKCLIGRDVLLLIATVLSFVSAIAVIGCSYSYEGGLAIRALFDPRKQIMRSKVDEKLDLARPGITTAHNKEPVDDDT